MKNTMNDLRNHLFATLEDLRDSDAVVDMDRVHMIVQVSQVLVNTAKAENEFLKITERGSGTGFISIPDNTKALDKGI